MKGHATEGKTHKGVYTPGKTWEECTPQEQANIIVDQIADTAYTKVTHNLRADTLQTHDKGHVWMKQQHTDTPANQCWGRVTGNWRSQIAEQIRVNDTKIQAKKARYSETWGHMTKSIQWRRIRKTPRRSYRERKRLMQYMWEKFATKHKMAKYQWVENGTCDLCGECEETEEHLFMSCTNPKICKYRKAMQTLITQAVEKHKGAPWLGTIMTQLYGVGLVGQAWSPTTNRGIPKEWNTAFKKGKHNMLRTLHERCQALAKETVMNMNGTRPLRQGIIPLAWVKLVQLGGISEVHKLMTTINEITEACREGIWKHRTETVYSQDKEEARHAYKARQKSLKQFINKHKLQGRTTVTKLTTLTASELNAWKKKQEDQYASQTHITTYTKPLQQERQRAKARTHTQIITSMQAERTLHHKQQTSQQRHLDNSGKIVRKLKEATTLKSDTQRQSHTIITQHMCRHVSGTRNNISGICSHSSIDITCGIHKNTRTDNRVIPGMYKHTLTGLRRIPDDHTEFTHLLKMSRTSLLKAYWPKKKLPSQEQFGTLHQVQIKQPNRAQPIHHANHDYLDGRPSSPVRPPSQALHQVLTRLQARIIQVLGDGHCLRRAIGKVTNIEPAEIIQRVIDMCMNWNHTTTKVNVYVINDQILRDYPTHMGKYSTIGTDRVIHNTYMGTQGRDEWSTETEIKLIASSLQRPIIVTNVESDEVRIYTTNKNEPIKITTIAHNEAAQERRNILLIHPIHLLYDPQQYAEHYNAVVLPYDERSYNHTIQQTQTTLTEPTQVTVHTNMETWINTMEPHTIRQSQLHPPPTSTQTGKQRLTIQQKKKQKTNHATPRSWTTSTKYLNGVRIEILLNDGNKETDLGWYEGTVTKVYDEFTIQWKCDDDEIIDQLNLIDTQWAVLPMNNAQEFLMNNRISAIKRKRKVNISPRKSRKHWKQQLNDTDLQSIKRRYKEELQQSKTHNKPTLETKNVKHIIRGHERLKQVRKRELDRGDGTSTEEDT